MNVELQNSCGSTCVACSSIEKQSNQKKTSGEPAGSPATNARSAASTLRNKYSHAWLRKTVGLPTWTAVGGSVSSSSQYDIVPGGDCAWPRPVPASRYAWANQRFAGLMRVTSSAQPAGTVAGLMIWWQTSLVVVAAVIVPAWPAANSSRPASEMPWRQ